MQVCAFDGCDRAAIAKGLCTRHYQKQRLYGTPAGRPVEAKGYVDDMGYRMLSIGGRKVREHVLVVERVLGRQLPKGPVIHHLNEVKTDNRHENLLVCQDEAYHQLIHRRTRAYDACGNANARQCQFCKQWSAPDRITVNPANSAAFHQGCRSADRRAKYAERKHAK